MNLFRSLGRRRALPSNRSKLERATMSASASLVRRLMLVALMLAVAVEASAQSASSDPTGTWLVSQGYARIKIVNCNGEFWGVVAWEQQSGLDSKNPDPAKRTRPTIGMPVLLAMKQSS